MTIQIVWQKLQFGPGIIFWEISSKKNALSFFLASQAFFLQSWSQRRSVWYGVMMRLHLHPKISLALHLLMWIQGLKTMAWINQVLNTHGNLYHRWSKLSSPAIPGVCITAPHSTHEMLGWKRILMGTMRASFRQVPLLLDPGLTPELIKRTIPEPFGLLRQPSFFECPWCSLRVLENAPNWMLQCVLFTNSGQFLLSFFRNEELRATQKLPALSYRLLRFRPEHLPESTTSRAAAM